MKKLILALMVLAMCFTLPVAAINWGDLPCNEEINIELTRSCGSFFDVTIVDEGKMYAGWCVQTGVPLLRSSSYDASLSKPVGEQWNKVNWILNNKGSATASEIQTAIWIVLNQGFTPGSDTPVVWDLVNNADPNFNECLPGNVGAVRVEPIGVEGQDLIIELPCCPDIPTPEFPTMMIPVFFVGSMLVAASVLNKE